ncbi:MAG: sulfatase/phosphatase domain-containing protein, partial [Chthoniobacteraceae bacterium]
LREAGLEENMIVVVWGDHGFLLGEHAIWGKHCLYEDALRSPLLIRHPGLLQPGKTSEAVVETVDLFPTLAELCGVAASEGLSGRSLRPQLDDPAASAAKGALGFWNNGLRTIRDERWRLIVRSGKDGGPAALELFDYQTDPGETRNHAEAQPDVVRELLARLQAAPSP